MDPDSESRTADALMLLKLLKLLLSPCFATDTAASAAGSAVSVSRLATEISDK